jgi:hypothetical protein
MFRHVGAILRESTKTKDEEWCVGHEFFGFNGPPEGGTPAPKHVVVDNYHELYFMIFILLNASVDCYIESHHPVNINIARDDLVLSFFMCVFVTALLIYFIIVVYSFYQKLKKTPQEYARVTSKTLI